MFHRKIRLAPIASLQAFTI